MAGETTEQEREGANLTDAEYQATFGDDGAEPLPADPTGEGETRGGDGGEAPAEAPADDGSASAPAEGDPAPAGGEEAPATEGGGEAEAAPEAPPEVPDWAKQPFAPQYTTDARALETIDADITALDNKLSEGELDLTEYQQQTRTLERERTKAETAQDFSQQNTEQAWGAVQEAFFTANPEYANDKIMFGALDATLQGLYADPQYSDYTMAQYLVEAKRQVDARFTGGDPAPAPEAEPAGDDTQAAADKGEGKQPSNAEVAQQRGGRPEAPATLNGVPEAEGEGTDPWAHINQLTGLDYEEALARLPADQAERFLAEG